jgi:hypothetical protein
VSSGPACNPTHRREGCVASGVGWTTSSLWLASCSQHRSTCQPGPIPPSLAGSSAVAPGKSRRLRPTSQTKTRRAGGQPLDTCSPAAPCSPLSITSGRRISQLCATRNAGDRRERTMVPARDPPSTQSGSTALLLMAFTLQRMGFSAKRGGPRLYLIMPDSPQARPLEARLVAGTQRPIPAVASIRMGLYRDGSDGGSTRPEHQGAFGDIIVLPPGADLADWWNRGF